MLTTVTIVRSCVKLPTPRGSNRAQSMKLTAVTLREVTVPGNYMESSGKDIYFPDKKTTEQDKEQDVTDLSTLGTEFTEVVE